MGVGLWRDLYVTHVPPKCTMDKGYFDRTSNAAKALAGCLQPSNERREAVDPSAKSVSLFVGPIRKIRRPVSTKQLKSRDPLPNSHKGSIWGGGGGVSLFEGNPWLC